MRAEIDDFGTGYASLTVLQGREAFPYLTVFENLRVVAEASEQSAAGVIEEVLERFPRLRRILDRRRAF